MVITAILGASIALFLKWPVEEYVESSRRAGITYAADAVFREMGRHIRTAVPNSVRVWGAISGSNSCNGTETCYLEYLETVAGGRYNSASPTDCFNISNASGVGVNCTTLTTTSNLVSGAASSVSTTLANGGTINGSAIINNTSLLVVYNQYNNSSNNCSNSIPSVFCSAANGGAPVITSVTNGTDPNQDVIAFAPHTFLPSGGSPSNSFQIVNQPATYVCSPNPTALSSGILTRYWNYGIWPTIASSVANFSAVSSAVLATNVIACKFYLKKLTRTNTVTTTDPAPTELVILNSTVAASGVTQSCDNQAEPCDSVSLYEEIKVTNVP